MTDKGKKSTSGDRSEAEGGIEVELGGLFRGLGDVVDLVSALAQAGEKHVQRQGEFKVEGLGDQARGVYGFSIRSGIAGGRPSVEPFGNVHASKDGLVVDDVREPLVDIFDEGDEIVITAELPGALESDVSLRLDGDVMVIETTGKRRYAKEVLLPGQVDAEGLRRSYNNGVLEVRARKRAPQNRDDT